MKMVNVTMLKTAKGSADGINVLTYEEGKSYSLNSELAKAFVNDMKVARVNKPKKVKEMQVEG